MRLRRPLLPLVALLALTGAACADEASSSPAPTASRPEAASAVAGGPTATSPYVLLDVRTPQEFADGHLEGAQLVSVEAADFATRIAALPKDAKYLIYCRSGNRANVAIAQMRAAGFTDLANLGSVADAASATGRKVIR